MNSCDTFEIKSAFKVSMLLSSCAIVLKFSMISFIVLFFTAGILTLKLPFAISVVAFFISSIGLETFLPTIREMPTPRTKLIISRIESVVIGVEASRLINLNL